LNLVTQRQNNFLGYRPVRNVNNEFLRYESVFSKRPFRELTVAQTLDTNVVCRVCMGSGQILNDSTRMGLIENTCPKCHGTKRMKSI